jgi:hypothetical protein
MKMEPSDRIRRVEAIPMRPCPPAGELAMLREPSLVAFSGPCACASRPGARLAVKDNEPRDVEPDRPRPKADELRLDEEHATATPLEDFTANVIASAADTTAMLAEHRATRPMRLRPSREGRILTLADAVFATGERAVVDVLGWWEGARSSAGPWAIWPPTFLLGLLEGSEGLLALECLLESLGPEEAMAVRVAADALAVSPHPGVPALAEDLLEAESPVARAIGVEVLSRRAGVDGERLMRLLDGEAPALIAASLRALVRVADAPPVVGRVLPLLYHSDPEVAWEAARAVTLWGAPDALRAVRDGQPLGATLGARAAELFVMAGDADDIAHLEALLDRTPLSPELLDAIGRFGNPLAWSFVLHFLIDRDLCEAAEGALLTLFGPLVPADAARCPSVWRDALAERDLDPEMRYRHGELWTPALVVDDCASAMAAPMRGAYSQRDIERWLDELAARTGIPMNANLARWKPGSELLATLDRVPRAGWRAGAWSGPRRELERRRT